jgi:signal recognition particle GTPase
MKPIKKLFFAAIRKQNSKHIFCLLSALFLANLSFAQGTTEVVTAWLKQNSIPIKYIEAGNSFSDLEPLKKILQDVQVSDLVKPHTVHMSLLNLSTA